jgi:rSAM/selenodomain-associated transferase 2
MSTGRKTSTLSVIIPCLNDGEALARTLERVTAAAGVDEVVVADGGSRDRSRETALAAGARVVVSRPGRGIQQNRGAEAARGDILFFLHADAIPPPGFPALVRETLADPEVAAGAFSLALDRPGRRAGIVCAGANLRARLLALPYGDQGLFFRRETFSRAGGFPEQEIMEDFELMRKVRRLGRVAVRPETVTASARRWEELGYLRTTLINQYMIVAYLLGARPASLSRRYRRVSRSR